MRHFAYKDGVLHAEDVNLQALAEEVGTPFYCYSTATLERHFRVMDGAFQDTDHLLCYAMKANSNQAVIKTMAALGAGMGTVRTAWRDARRRGRRGVRQSGKDPGARISGRPCDPACRCGTCHRVSCEHGGTSLHRPMTWVL